MKDYAKAAKELIDKAAKLTIRQEGPRQPAPSIVLQASSSPQGPRPTVPVEARVSRFKQELLASRINLHELRRLAFQGIPDKDGLRAMTWKLLLGYLPPDPSEWDEVLARKRTEYLLFCQLKTAVPEDHPLSLQSTSKWHTYFKDSEIMEQIDRDVMRTHPDMHFFSGDSVEAEQHRKEMKRCLFMYAKLNPGLRYIQGMNELLAPLYYMFSTDPDSTSARYAEADAFYCFVDLISEFRDHFCQQLDNSSSGIKATISKLVTVLQAHDAELADHLQRHKVDPQFFAFRWITLLLTQEFPFPDAVRIWDTLLSDPGGRLDCLLRVCVALLRHVREQLLAGDFAVIVKTLQRYPSVDVDLILRSAARLPPCSQVLGVPL
eukprot:gene13965-14079_t